MLNFTSYEKIDIFIFFISWFIKSRSLYHKCSFRCFFVSLFVCLKVDIIIVYSCRELTIKPILVLKLCVILLSQAIYVGIIDVYQTAFVLTFSTQVYLSQDITQSLYIGKTMLTMRVKRREPCRFIDNKKNCHSEDSTIEIVVQENLPL